MRTGSFGEALLAQAPVMAALRAADSAQSNTQDQTQRRRRRGGRGRGRAGDQSQRWASGDVRHAPNQTRGEAPAHRHAPRPLPLMQRRGPPCVSQVALEPLGRLVIVTDTDLPCSVNVAVCVPGDHSGLKCAYLDSELYNHFGWWWEPPKELGEPGGVIDIAKFGMRLDVMPRKDGGAWRFQTSPVTQRAARFETSVDVVGGRKRLTWSPRDVGISVLHIRWKGEIEAKLQEMRNAAQKGGQS